MVPQPFQRRMLVSLHLRSMPISTPTAGSLRQTPSPPRNQPTLTAMQDPLHRKRLLQVHHPASPEPGTVRPIKPLNNNHPQSPRHLLINPSVHLGACLTTSRISPIFYPPRFKDRSTCPWGRKIQSKSGARRSSGRRSGRRSERCGGG